MVAFASYVCHVLYSTVVAFRILLDIINECYRDYERAIPLGEAVCQRSWALLF